MCQTFPTASLEEEGPSIFSAGNVVSGGRPPPALIPNLCHLHEKQSMRLLLNPTIV